MADKTEQRQAINNITLVGMVKENKLNVGSNKDGKFINGSLVLNTGEFSEIEIKVFVKEKTKKGTTNKTYDTLNKIINKEYLTLADCKSAEDREYVTKVRVYGNKEFVAGFKEDIFKAKGSEDVVTKLTVDLGFGSIIADSSIKEEDFKAEFDVEMYVTSVKEETKGNEPTGRTIVSGWTPVYGGKVIPMEVVAGVITDDNGDEYDFGEDMLSQIEEGMTIDVWGNIDYRSIITKTTKGGGLGKAKVEESKTYINDLVIIGGDIQEDEEKEFDMELIKKAKTERDTEIENVKNEKTDDDKKSKGLNKGTGTANKEDKPKRQRPNF